MNEPEIRISDSPEALATDVAEHLLVALADAQAARRLPHVALTGGTIAETIHETVARLAGSSQVDWRKVAFWWGDERFVAPDSDDRNDRAARIGMLDRLDVDPALVHPVPSTEDAGSVAEAATIYGDLLRASGAGEFEVVMLGVGPDGHVASLFPGRPEIDVEDAIAVPVTDSPKPPPERVSLTLPALNHTRATWFVVSGEGKAEAVATALSGGDVPAARPHGTQETIWFLDEAAASQL
ncbi:6-phosphogluconolactonase [Nocardioides mangrovicus]|uniref:6-phosphogluconolactonase n=1 Tax=Nocardioides mangrovicus TaxID=2478913 RepID=A0A3L8P2S3_9ACTN|nr:6-phosphogluconolactonase [Nocardioides mangrovicus]RLV49351.1 6-phosphogluconolactonase [Nocardioides mangrovicus]